MAAFEVTEMEPVTGEPTTAGLNSTPMTHSAPGAMAEAVVHVVDAGSIAAFETGAMLVSCSGALPSLSQSLADGGRGVGGFDVFIEDASDGAVDLAHLQAKAVGNEEVAGTVKDQAIGPVHGGVAAIGVDTVAAGGRARVSSESGDDIGGSVDFADDVVFGVGDVEVAASVHYDGGWLIQHCSKSVASVAGEARCTRCRRR